jgi:HAMP domain-containing protein
MTGELDRLSRTLEATAHGSFISTSGRRARQDALAGRVTPVIYAGDAEAWPDTVRACSGRAANGTLGLSHRRRSHDHAPRRRWWRRRRRDYRRDLRGIRMEDLSSQFRHTRAGRRGRRTRSTARLHADAPAPAGTLSGSCPLAPLAHIAHRISRPIQQLTAGLTDFAAGDWTRRVETTRGDEVGKAVEAFNDYAQQLRREP